MALVSPKGRLVADPCIGVEDLMACLEKVFKDKGTRDIWELLRVPRGLSFKSGVNPQWLASIYYIMLPFCEIAQNGMLPPKKTRMALQKLHSQCPINFTKKANNDFFDQTDEALRVAFAQYRKVKANSTARDTAMRYLSTKQKNEITMVLDRLIVTPEDPDRPAPSCDQVVPAEEPSHEKNPAQEPSPDKKTKKNREPVVSPTVKKSRDRRPDFGIFKRVLERVSSEEGMKVESSGSTSKRGPSHDRPLIERLIEGEGDLPESSGGMPEPEEPGSEEDVDEEKLIDEAVEVIPIGEGGQSQLQIFRKNAKFFDGKNEKAETKKKPTKEGKAKSKVKVMKKPSSFKDPKPKKKPSASDLRCSPGDLDDEKEENDKEEKEEHDMEDATQKYEPADIEPKDDGEVVGVRYRRKTSLSPKNDEPPSKKKKMSQNEATLTPEQLHRKNTTSKAYHQGYKEAIRNGKSKEKAKEAGRKEAQKIRDQLDAAANEQDS